jgi:hypothetical protein
MRFSEVSMNTDPNIVLPDTRESVVAELKKHCDAPDYWYGQFDVDTLKEMLIDILSH